MATISADRRTGRAAQPAARCSSSKKKQAAVCTAGLAANGFLRHRFLPLYQEPETVPEAAQVEQGFFKSLSILAGSYAVRPLDVSGKPYPYNVLLSHWDAQQQLKLMNRDIDLFIAADENEATLTTKETVSTGANLYYIPVLPLFRLLCKRQHKEYGELLLSVCAYLLRVAGVPYYRDEGSYLFYQYEMLQLWYEEDMENLDEGDYLRYKNEWQRAAQFGDIMGRKLHNPCHLRNFKERVSKADPQNRFQRECLNTARAALALWEEYPAQTIYAHMREQDGTEEDEMNGEDIIKVTQYISFTAETEGCLYDSLAEMVNNEFNECSCVQEPGLTVYFNGTMPEQKDSLDFDRRLLRLIEDLCTILYDLP